MTDGEVSAPTSTPPVVAKEKRERLVDVDHVKAIAIILVVYGHVVAREGPKGISWYMPSKEVLYLFHMPLFMFVTGLVFGYTYRPFSSVNEYFAFVTKRVGRIFPAYLILAGLIFLGKVLATRVMHVDNAPANLSDIVLVITRPYDSASAFLWYVYVLAMYVVAVPLLMRLFKGNVLGVVAVGAGLYFVPRTNAFGIGQFCEFLVFFATGIWTVSVLPQLRALSTKYFPVWCIAFAGLLASAGWLAATHALTTQIGLYGMLLVGFCSIPFFFGLAHKIKGQNFSELDTVAKYTFTIYLFNTLAIGLIKGLGTKFFNWNGSHFYLYLPLLWICGVVLPILLHQKLLGRFRWLSSITL